MSKSKAQGTAEELRQRRLLEARGFRVVRLAEGGQDDEGDLRVFLGQASITIESKDRAALNIHETLQKAQRKAHPRDAVVWWKRKERQNGNTRRTQVGKPVVVMSEELFFSLLKGFERGSR